MAQPPAAWCDSTASFGQASGKLGQRILRGRRSRGRASQLGRISEEVPLGCDSGMRAMCATVIAPSQRSRETQRAGRAAQISYLLGMRARAAFLVWVGVGLCGTSFGPLACGVGRHCTLVGCSDGEQLAFSVVSTQVSETDVSFCRQGRCWHGRLSAADLSTIAAHKRVDLQADDGTTGSFVECLIDTPLPPGEARLTFSWSATSDTPVAVGDVLTATFSDASGSVVLSESGSVGSFEEYYPNGKECDKVGCRTGSAQGSAD